nr:hypothetical protein [Blastococcus sp. TML/M2B]
MREFVGVLGSDQVGASGRAVQHGAAGEDGLHGAVGVGERVADVVVGVPRRVQHPQSHRAGLEHVAVGGRHALVRHVVPGGDDVPRADRPGELEAAGQVVVVQVGLQDQRDAHAALPGRRQHAVDVALGVDHDADPTVADQVAAVAEAGGLDDVDLHDGSLYGTGQGYLRGK